MTVSRRSVLVAALGSGTLAAVAGPLWALEAEGLAAQPATGAVRLLVGGAPAAFAPAMQQALAGRGHPPAGLVAVAGPADLRASLDWLGAAPGRRLVGLIADADAVVLRELARDRAVRWLAAGQHRGEPGAALGERHRFAALPGGAVLARAVAADRAAAGVGGLVTLDPQPGAATPPAGMVRAADRAQGWETALAAGLALALDAPAVVGDPGGRVHAGRGPVAPGPAFSLSSFVIAA